ncbi:Uncharacterized protein PBTT_10078 [Plasmodiophora brassicae]|uniref:Uncharacterized protein n=1 Tax=Plasmodiophora brassicae TaxID=37360 RepID=A0A3P3YP79_PLABS|nr:unnamed protein product [Plasmodiophora brassicae]
MAIGRASTCCCGCSLPMGIMVFSSLYFINGIVLFVAGHTVDTVAHDKDWATWRYAESFAYIAASILFLVTGILSSEALCLAALFVNIALSIYNVVGTMINYSVAGTGASVLPLIKLPLAIYFAYIIWSYYELTKEQNRAKASAPPTRMPPQQTVYPTAMVPE